MKLFLFAVFLVIVQAVPPVPRRAAATTGQGGDNGKNQSQQNQKSTPSLPLVAPLKQPPTPEQHSGDVAPYNTHDSVELTRIPPVTIVKDKLDIFNRERTTGFCFKYRGYSFYTSGPEGYNYRR
jgi:hypothetical protein